MDLDRLQMISVDKGYDWTGFREELRDADVRPVINHGEFSPLDMGHNARHDDDTYHQRLIAEAAFFALKQQAALRRHAPVTGVVREVP